MAVIDMKPLVTLLAIRRRKADGTNSVLRGKELVILFKRKAKAVFQVPAPLMLFGKLSLLFSTWFWVGVVISHLSDVFALSTQSASSHFVSFARNKFLKGFRKFAVNANFFSIDVSIFRSCHSRDYAISGGEWQYFTSTFK